MPSFHLVSLQERRIPGRASKTHECTPCSTKLRLPFMAYGARWVLGVRIVTCYVAAPKDTEEGKGRRAEMMRGFIEDIKRFETLSEILSLSMLVLRVLNLRLIKFIESMLCPGS